MLPQEAWFDETSGAVVRIPEAGSPLLTVDETAEFLHVSAAVLQAWAKVGLGPPFYGWAKTPFYLRDEVGAWLGGQPSILAAILAAELEGNRS